MKSLPSLLSENLIDYIAMDIKAPLTASHYQRVTNVPVDINTLKRSISLIMQSSIPYEFRTTCSKHWLSYQDILSIARDIHGAKRFRLQHFKSPDHSILLDDTLDETQNFSEKECQDLIKHIHPFITDVSIR